MCLRTAETSVQTWPQDNTLELLGQQVAPEGSPGEAPDPIQTTARGSSLLPGNHQSSQHLMEIPVLSRDIPFLLKDRQP